jgi:hypothetical protein
MKIFPRRKSQRLFNFQEQKNILRDESKQGSGKVFDRLAGQSK